MTEKQKLLISFSGGRTSAYMTKLILDRYSDKYDILVVFANTGRERKETFDFIKNCDNVFGFNTIWIEAITNPVHRKGITAKVVDYDTADLTGRVFEDSIKKHGIPNIMFPHCTRELKTTAIRSYLRSIGWKRNEYYMAIGIRADEIDRINPKWKQEKIVYPMISWIPTTKLDVNEFWLNQPFDLQLRSFEGNCDFCWKKSPRKLMTIAKELPNIPTWWDEMEQKYGDYVPKSYKSELIGKTTFFRDHKSAKDYIELAKQDFEPSRDESKDRAEYKQSTMFNFELDLGNGCIESCEPF